MAILTAAISAIILGTLLFAQVSAQLSITADVDPPGAYLTKGDKIMLTCTSTNPLANLTWLWQNPKDNSSVNVLTMPEVAAADRGSIGISSVSGKIGGNYSCTDGSALVSYFVNVLDADSLIPHHVTTNGTDDKVVLQCGQRLESDKRLPLIWTRKLGDGKEIVLNNAPVEDKNFTVESAEKGYSLTVRNKEKRRYPLKTGEYQCRFNTTGVLTTARGAAAANDRAIFQTVIYESKPDVRIEGVSGAKTKSATKDEPLQLQCVFNSHNPQTYAVWKYHNETVNVTEALNDQHWDSLPACPQDADKRCINGRIFSLKEANTSEHGQYEKTVVLEFDVVHDEDKGFYTCEVHEFDGDLETLNSAKFELKVKDKLAALWPFLGIVAEVVILCAIIFIYEKRRNKTVDEEDESEPMKGEVHERDGARSRK